MNDVYLQLTNLCCQTKYFCLGGIDLQVRSGEYLMITGITGSGKTMLLELIAGLQQPTAGKIFCNGNEITSWLPERRVLGFAYQDSLLYPFLTVRENILFGAKITGRGKETELQERALMLAAMMGLSHLLERDPRRLSGGERQRVSLARALLLQPPLLLLDEPLSALDECTKKNLRKLLLHFYRQRKMTVLHVTHDPDDVAELGTRTVVMENGKLQNK